MVIGLKKKPIDIEENAYRLFSILLLPVFCTYELTLVHELDA